jgi:2-dehydro-3-deoxy-D-arabinonate dehydratase
MIRILRTLGEEGPRAGFQQENGTVDVLDHDDPLTALRGRGRVTRTDAIENLTLLAPIEAPEIWCAGVTYERSRDARLDEAETAARDVYALVYEADRPELFLKDAAMRRTVGPGGEIRGRRDARWTVPEPELAVVIGAGGEAAALTIGNDVTSRDIEGANPLYLPQAKIYAGSCAIGPALVVPDDWDAPRTIRLLIRDPEGRELFDGETSTARMRRTPRDLLSWLQRDNPVPPGSVLLTGTGLVPPDTYTLAPGHRVDVTIEGIGTLTNTVAD